MSISDRIPGSGTSAYPVYHCERCHDSGSVFAKRLVRVDGYRTAIEGYFLLCVDCDGKSRLCGEVDAPTPALDAQRNMKHGGPA